MELGQVRRLRHRLEGEGLGEVAVGEVARPPQRDQDLWMAQAQTLGIGWCRGNLNILVVLHAQMRDLLLAHQPAESVLQLCLLNEQIILGIDV